MSRAQGPYLGQGGTSPGRAGRQAACGWLPPGLVKPCCPWPSLQLRGAVPAPSPFFFEIPGMKRKGARPAGTRCDFLRLETVLYGVRPWCISPTPTPTVYSAGVIFKLHGQMVATPKIFEPQDPVFTGL